MKIIKYILISAVVAVTSYAVAGLVSLMALLVVHKHYRGNWWPE
jgi:hypothetical protein